MKPGILISKIWSDDDLIELRIDVSDEDSLFSNRTCIDNSELIHAASSLGELRSLLDLQFGRFGPEYAEGAFHAQFQLLLPGRIYISCEQESDFEKFVHKKEVARRATLYLISEPGLLDRFVAGLRSMADGKTETAFLEAIG